MIQYAPKREYFNWEIPCSIPSEHWQQLLVNVPYDEMAKYLSTNPAIKYAIEQRIKQC